MQCCSTWRRCIRRPPAARPDPTPHKESQWRTLLRKTGAHPPSCWSAAACHHDRRMGIRHGFGLFLQPMSADLHWGRETFALAMAVQNLVWGATQPFSGMLADSYGTAQVVVAGAVLYAAGLARWPPRRPADADPDRRRADRRRAVRPHVQRHLRRAGPRLSAREAEHGARHFGRGRVLRPVRACCR